MLIRETSQADLSDGQPHLESAFPPHGNLRDDRGESLSVNTQTGEWADFATHDRGSDPVSLEAAKDHDGNQGEATRALGAQLGVHVNGTAHDATRRQQPPKGSRPKLDCYSADTLEGKVFEPVRWTVPLYVPEGLTVFAGRPKIGKSWLMLGIALGVSRGKEALGQFLNAGDVLYCGLEDGPRRMQDRIGKILGPEVRGWPERLDIIHKLDAIDAGGIDQIAGWLIDHPEARLVIIDTLGKVRGQKGPQEEQYRSDYRVVGALQELATKHRVAIVIVHHVRKSLAGDILDTVSGTTGIAGAADTVMVLDMTSKGARLYLRGRDVEEQDKLLEFDPETARWEVVDDYDADDPDGGLQGLRKRIHDCLVKAGAPVTPVVIAERLEAKRAQVRMTLYRMTKANPPQVRKSPTQVGAYEAIQSGKR